MINEKKQLEQNKIYKENNNLIPLHFTMSKNQYDKLKELKDHGFCKIMYLLRFAAYSISKTEGNNIKVYVDHDFSTKEGKHYKIDLPTNVYQDIKQLSENTGLSMSKLMRIGINNTLKF